MIKKLVLRCLGDEYIKKIHKTIKFTTNEDCSGFSLNKIKRNILTEFKSNGKEFAKTKLNEMISSLYTNIIYNTQFLEIIKNSDKKVLILTNNDIVIENLEYAFYNKDIKYCCCDRRSVIDKKTKDILEFFKDSENHNVLIANPNLLPMELTLTEVNTIFFMDSSIKKFDKAITIKNIYTIGQNENVTIYEFEYDTENYVNLFNNISEIENWFTYEEDRKTLKENEQNLTNDKVIDRRFGCYKIKDYHRKRLCRLDGRIKILKDRLENCETDKCKKIISSQIRKWNNKKSKELFTRNSRRA